MNQSTSSHSSHATLLLAMILFAIAIITPAYALDQQEISAITQIVSDMSSQPSPPQVAFIQSARSTFETIQVLSDVNAANAQQQMQSPLQQLQQVQTQLQQATQASQSGTQNQQTIQQLQQQLNSLNQQYGNTLNSLSQTVQQALIDSEMAEDFQTAFAALENCLTEVQLMQCKSQSGQALTVATDLAPEQQTASVLLTADQISAVYTAAGVSTPTTNDQIIAVQTQFCVAHAGVILDAMKALINSINQQNAAAPAAAAPATPAAGVAAQ